MGATPTKMNRFRIFLFWFLSFGVALASWRFLAMGLEAAFPNMVNHLESQRLAFIVHITAGPIALVILPFQLWRGLRTRGRRLHRWMGRTYGVMVGLAGLSGLVIAITTNAGPVAATGFAVLAVLWLWTTAQAVLHARAGRIAQHRAFMIRSAALTFAGVTLRLWLPVFLVPGIPFEIAYPIIAFLCWIPNLMVAEYMIRRRGNALSA
jgi:uncharacterized membrane protein